MDSPADYPAFKAYEGLIEAKANPAALELLWFDDIQKVTKAQDFVQGVLIKGSAAVIYGESNSGKTFWTTDLALHVAAGKRWNDRRVDQGAVVYCVLEGGNGFRNRVAAWRDAHCPDIDMPFAAIQSAVNLLDPEADTPRLIEAIRHVASQSGHPTKLVVIDTLSRAFAGGNENTSEDMGALVMNMDRIRTETGACVLFVHHCGKDAARGARGHSSLLAAIDTEIEVTADEDTGERTAHVAKQRDLTKGSKFGFRLETVLIGENEHGEPVTTCITRMGEVDAAPKKLGIKLTADEQGWLSDINALFAEPGLTSEAVCPMPGMLPVRGATRGATRDWLIRRGRIGVAPVAGSVAFNGGLTSTDRSSLLRYLNRLKDKGKIGLSEDWVWLLR